MGAGEVVTKLGAEVNVKITYKDYLQFPDEGKRTEVIDGRGFVTPAPNVPHQRVLVRLLRLLADHVESHDLGEVFAAPCDVVLDDTTIVQPDLFFVSKKRRSIVKKTRIAGAPDLVVELLSPSTAARDRSIKLQAYEQHGVAHYWIVDPDGHKLAEYVLTGKKLRLVAKRAGPVAFTPRVFPDLEIDLAKVWPE